MSAPDGFRTCFRKAEVLHLAGLDQLLHRSSHVLDRHIRIDAMLIEQVDDIGLEPLERNLCDFLDVGGPAVQAVHALPVRPDPESELRRDHHLPAEGSEGFAHEFLVLERTIDFRGVEEGDAAFNRRANHRDHRLLFPCRAVARAHAHAAQPEGRDFQITFSKFALLHN